MAHPLPPEWQHLHRHQHHRQHPSQAVNHFTAARKTTTTESQSTKAGAVKKYLAYISHHKTGSGAAGSAWLVKDYLESGDSDGDKVFVDQEDVGQTNIVTLLQLLKSSKVVVLLLTKHALHRLYVLFEVYCAIGNEIPIVAVIVENGGYDANVTEKFLLHLDKNLDKEGRATIEKYGLDVLDFAYKLSNVVPFLPKIKFNFKDAKARRNEQLQAIKDAVFSATTLPIYLKKEEWIYQRNTDKLESIPMAVALLAVDDGAHEGDVQIAHMVEQGDLTILSAVHELESCILGMNPDAVAAACDYLFEKCGGDAVRDEDYKVREDIVAAGGIRIVVLGLEQFMGSQNRVAIVGLLKLFRNLARNDENKPALMEDVSTVLANVVGQMQSISVQQWCSLIIVALATDDENRAALVKMGAGDIIIQGLTTHKSDPGLQFNGCAALALLSKTPSVQTRLMKTGAAEAILRAMDGHKSNASIQTQGCAALFYLATQPENKTLLITMGAAEIVIEAMLDTAFTFETNLQKFGCAFIFSASMAKANVPRLVSLRAKDAVGMAMKHHSLVGDLQEYGEKALDNLARG